MGHNVKTRGVFILGLSFFLGGLLTSSEKVTEWHLVFKATTGGPFGVYDLYTSSSSLNEDNTTAQQLDNELPVHFKSDFINKWPEKNVSLVKVSVFKDGIERAFHIFNGTESSSLDWFSGNRLINTSYQDINLLKGSIRHFSIRGDDSSGVVRRFFINYQYSGCSGDTGWLLVTDEYKPSKCDVDKVRSTAVFFSNSSTLDIYNNFETADCLAVFVERTVLSREECPCECAIPTNQTYITINDTDALQKSLAEIQNALKIQRNTTSKYLRTKRSATDDRASSTGVGLVLGAGILVFLSFLIVIPDIPMVLNHLGIKCFKGG